MIQFHEVQKTPFLAVFWPKFAQDPRWRLDATRIFPGVIRAAQIYLFKNARIFIRVTSLIGDLVYPIQIKSQLHGDLLSD